MQRITAIKRVFAELERLETLERADLNISPKSSAETSVTGFVVSCIETDEFSLQRGQNIVFFERNVKSLLTKLQNSEAKGTFA